MALALLCGTFDMSFEPSLLTGAKTNIWAEKSYVLLENSSSRPFPRLNRDCSWRTCSFCNCWNVKLSRVWCEIITNTNSKVRLTRTACPDVLVSGAEDLFHPKTKKTFSVWIIHVLVTHLWPQVKLSVTMTNTLKVVNDIVETLKCRSISISME